MDGSATRLDGVRRRAHAEPDTAANAAADVEPDVEPDTAADAAADVEPDAPADIQPDENPDSCSLAEPYCAAYGRSDAAAHAIPDAEPNAAVSTWHAAPRHTMSGLHGRSIQRIGKRRDMRAMRSRSIVDCTSRGVSAVCARPCHGGPRQRRMRSVG